MAGTLSWRMLHPIKLDCVMTASRWRHQMETFSALLALCAWNSSVTGKFPSQRPVTRSFDVFFDLRLNKRLRKQSKRRDLIRHCALYDFTVMLSCSLLDDMYSSLCVPVTFVTHVIIPRPQRTFDILLNMLQTTSGFKKKQLTKSEIHHGIFNIVINMKPRGPFY